MENKLYVVLGIVLLLGLAARPLKADELAELEKQAAGGTSLFSRFSNWFGGAPAPAEEPTEEAARPESSSFQLSVASTADIAPVPAPPPVVAPAVTVLPASTPVVVQQPLAVITPLAKPSPPLPASSPKMQDGGPQKMAQKTSTPRKKQVGTESTLSTDEMADEPLDAPVNEGYYSAYEEQSSPQHYAKEPSVEEGAEEAVAPEFPSEINESNEWQEVSADEAERSDSVHSSGVDSTPAKGRLATQEEDVWYEEEASNNDVAPSGNEIETADDESKINIKKGSLVKPSKPKLKPVLPVKSADQLLLNDEEYEELSDDGGNSAAAGAAADVDEYVEVEEEIEIPDDEEEAALAAVVEAGVDTQKAGDAKSKLLGPQSPVLKDAAPGAKGLKQQAKKGKKKIIKRKRWLMRKKGMLKRKAMRQRRLLKQAAKAGTIGKKLAVKKNLVVAKKPIVSKKPMPSKKVINVIKSGKGKKIILRRRRLIRKKRALKKVPKSLPQRKSSTAAVPVAQKQGEAGQKPAVENKVSGTETSALAKVPTVLPVKTVVAPKTARKAAKPVRKQKKQPIKLARLKARKRAAAKKQQQKKVAASKALAQPAPKPVPAPTTPVAATEIAKPAPVAGPAVKKTGESK